MKKAFFLTVMLTLSIIIASSVSADTITSSYSIPWSDTDWDAFFDVAKFDPTLGTLNSIAFTFQGDIQGSADFENRSSSPAQVTLKLSSILQLQRPDSTLLVEAIPLYDITTNVTAYDNVLDYGGTSGHTYSGLTASKTESYVSSLLSDLTLFTGSGNINLPVTATATSRISGPGNLIGGFSTEASALATITYDYTPVPEPSSMVALLAGMGGLAGLIRRRRNR